MFGVESPDEIIQVCFLSLIQVAYQLRKPSVQIFSIWTNIKTFFYIPKRLVVYPYFSKFFC
ncbi:hypothetical protein GGQ21_003093 [Salinibacter ruber]|nr:hypothetical protein [Salinibacter ruber]